MTPKSRATQALVAWYAVFQLAHFILNSAYIVGDGPPPFHPPPEGWLPQTVAFIDGIAFADWVNSVLSLVFAWGYFRARRFAPWLGTLCLTISTYAAFVFTWGAVASGAGGLGRPYLWVNLPFIPVIVLFVAWCYWGARGQLGLAFAA